MPRIETVLLIRFHTRGKPEPTFAIHLIPKIAFVFSENWSTRAIGEEQIWGAAVLTDKGLGITPGSV